MKKVIEKAHIQLKLVYQLFKLYMPMGDGGRGVNTQTRGFYFACHFDPEPTPFEQFLDPPL